MSFGDWLNQAFSKFSAVSLSQWVMLLTLLLLGGGLAIFARKKVKWNTRMLTFASLSIALSFVLSTIRLFKMPQGGSVTPGGMLPLLIYAYAFGPVPGLMSGLVFGLLDFLQSAAPITNIWSFALDYLVGFAMVGLAGLFKGIKQQQAGLAAGIITACTARFAASVLSGVMFYAMYAEGTGMSPFIYSCWYNGSYMLPETLICVVLGLAVSRQILRVVKTA